jgi:hypothetical protein
MKELFDQLRDLMPQERGSKASKWEILSKGTSQFDQVFGCKLTVFSLAIAEHQRQSDHIKQIGSLYQNALQEAEMLRRELDRLRMENNQLRNGVAAGSAPANQPTPVQQPPADPYAQDPYGRSSRPELPPLRALSGNLPNGPESMTGVQYEAQRPSAFRQDRF